MDMHNTKLPMHQLWVLNRDTRHLLLPILSTSHMALSTSLTRCNKPHRRSSFKCSHALFWLGKEKLRLLSRYLLKLTTLWRLLLDEDFDVIASRTAISTRSWRCWKSHLIRWNGRYQLFHKMSTSNKFIWAVASSWLSGMEDSMGKSITKISKT